MLDRLWPNAVAMSCVLQLTVISGADVVSFGAQNVSCGMPVAPTLAPWGTIERSRDTWEHKKGDLGVQAWISVDLRWSSGPHFESFWLTLEQHVSFYACLLVFGLRFERLSGLNLDVWGSRSKHLVSELLQKLTFRICRDSVGMVSFSKFLYYFLQFR